MTSTDLELVDEGDERGQVVVTAGRRERSGDAADHHLLASEDVRRGHILFFGGRNKGKEERRKK